MKSKCVQWSSKVFSSRRILSSSRAHNTNKSSRKTIMLWVLRELFLGWISSSLFTWIKSQCNSRKITICLINLAYGGLSIQGINFRKFLFLSFSKTLSCMRHNQHCIHHSECFTHHYSSSCNTKYFSRYGTNLFINLPLNQQPKASLTV